MKIKIAIIFLLLTLAMPALAVDMHKIIDSYTKDEIDTILILYLKADGTVTGATSQIQSFTNGITDGTISIAGGDIVSTGSIDIKPSGDADDYLTYSTVIGVPRITVQGGERIDLFSTTGSIFTAYNGINNLFGWDDNTSTFVMSSTGKILLQSGSNLDITLNPLGTGVVNINSDLVATGTGHDTFTDTDPENHINTGATVPASPVKSEIFLHTPTGRNVLMQYNGSNWIPLHNLSSTTIYVDGTSGTDSIDKGGSSGSGAFATIQYAIDSLAGVLGGNVTINVSNDSYAEDIIIGGKAFTGNYTITLAGTLSLQETTTDSAVTQGGTTTQGYVVDSELTGDNYNDMLCYFETDGEYRVIDYHSGSQLDMTLYAPSGTTQSVSIYDWGTDVDSITIRPHQTGIILQNLEFNDDTPDITGAVVCELGSKADLYRIRITSGTSRAVRTSPGSQVELHECLFDTRTNCDGGKLIVHQSKTETTDLIGYQIGSGGSFQLGTGGDTTDASILRDLDNGGRAVQLSTNSDASLTTSYHLLDNWNVGLYSLYGSQIRGNANAQLNTCNTEEFADASQMAWISGNPTEYNTTIHIKETSAAETSTPGFGQYWFKTNGVAYYTDDSGNDYILSDHPSATGSYDTTDAITVTHKIMRVQGNGAAKTLTSTPTIVDLVDGQIITIQGDHDTNTLTLQDNSNLAGSGLFLENAVDMTLGKGDMLMLSYDAGDDRWYEISRSDN